MERTQSYVPGPLTSLWETIKAYVEVTKLRLVFLLTFTCVGTMVVAMAEQHTTPDDLLISLHESQPLALDTLTTQPEYERPHRPPPLPRAAARPRINKPS